MAKNGVNLNMGEGDDVVSLNSFVGLKNSIMGGIVDLGAGNDEIYLAGRVALRVLLEGGSGEDSLVYTQEVAQSLNVIRGIENIDITAGAKSVISDVTLSNVMANMDANGDTTDLHALRINGTSKDLVKINTKEWQHVDTQDVEGITYNVYHHANSSSDLYDVWVQAGINVL